MEEERNSGYSQREFRRQRRHQHRKRQELRWEHHLQRRRRHCENMHRGSKAWLGLLIILIGVLWLLRANGVFIPDWLFSWPMLWVAIGIFTGFASRFHNWLSPILILLGLVFLLRDFIYPDMELDKYLWPCLVIAVGIMFLVKRRGIERKREWLLQNHPQWQDWRSQWQQQMENKVQPTDAAPEAGPIVKENVENETFKKDEWIDITTVFGGTRRNVISKHFKGGDITNVCGGTEIDLTRADIQGNAVIDLLGVWGGIRIAVPPNWQVQLNFTNVMAGTDDRRTSDVPPDPNKILTLNGTLFMAGIEIRDAL